MAGKKSGGKGSGTHAARKNKYQAHAAGASRKGGNKKSTGGAITMRNKAVRAKRHVKLMAKQQTRCSERLELLEKVKAKYPKANLSKKYGTLNIRRLTDILNGTAENSLWYKARVARREANAQARSAKVVRKHVRFRKKRKEKDVSKGLQAVHGKSGSRDRSTQVDQE